MTMEATPLPTNMKPRNDNSNPQQGTGTVGRPSGAEIVHTRPSLQIPPTRKDARKLFVGGLPADITDDEFRAFFEQFGALMDAIVMFDRETNRSRGFGFVSFEDPAVAQKLLTMGNDGTPAPCKPTSGHLEMRGKIIEIKAAEPKESAPSRRHSTSARRNQAAPAPVYSPYGMPPVEYPLAAEYNAFYPPMFAGYMAPAYYPMVPPVDPSMSTIPADVSSNYPYPGYAFYPMVHGPPGSYLPPPPAMPPVATGSPEAEAPAGAQMAA